MTTREWLEHIERGAVPDTDRKDQHLASLRKMGFIGRDESGYHLTPKGDQVLAHWRSQEEMA